jgi:hypothetical protein
MCHSEEVLTPVLLRGVTTRPLKPKNGRLGGRWHWWSRQRRQPPLHDHLSADDSGHLYTSGLPATAATSPRAERSSPPSPYGGEDKTIQGRDRHLCGIRRLVRPPGRHQGRVAGCAGNDRSPSDGRTVVPRLAAGGGAKAIQAKEPGTRQLAAPAAGRPRVAEVRLLRKAGEHPSPPNAGGRSWSPAHAEGRTPTRLVFHPSEDDEHP